MTVQGYRDYKKVKVENTQNFNSSLLLVKKSLPTVTDELTQLSLQNLASEKYYRFRCSRQTIYSITQFFESTIGSTLGKSAVTPQLSVI